MSRSGYVDYDLDPLELGRYRAQVASATRGNRGQTFLKELAAAMDAMPVKELIAGELVNASGQCCTIGVVCKSRGLDVSQVAIDEPEQVAGAVGIARQLAAEIEHENDDDDGWWAPGDRAETPSHRWERMRKWVEQQILTKKGGAAACHKK
jgi:hypothetical protein